LTFAKDGRQVPFYLQPTLGGNDDLRGFSQYRFYDNNYIYASAEHRWFVFEGLDMAAFIDTGKVVAERRDIDFTDLSVSAGLGFRWKLQGTVFMRMDVAAGREGVRFIWTFSDIYRFRWINR
jgi:outer membrane protein assembly factor BamA